MIFKKRYSQKARQIKMKFEELKEIGWHFPEMDYIKYDPKMRGYYYL